MSVNDEKKYYLKKEGCLNPNASKISADIFNDGNVFLKKQILFKLDMKCYVALTKMGFP